MSDIAIGWMAIGEAKTLGLEDLLIGHFLEVESDTDTIPLDIDWPKYLHLERVGIFRSLCAVKAGRLVGYNSFYIQMAMHHRQSLWAVNDVLYLDPDERKGLVGARLIKTAEKALAELKVVKVLYESRTGPHFGHGKARGTLGSLLDKLGYAHAGCIFEKLL